MKTMDSIKYKRGTVWLRQVSPEDVKNRPGVTDGTRPVLVISNDINNANCSSVVCLKCTTNTSHLYIPSNVKINVDDKFESVILCNQVETITKSELKVYMYSLSDDAMERVDSGLKETFCLGTGTNDYEVEEDSPSPEICSFKVDHGEVVLGPDDEDTPEYDDASSENEEEEETETSSFSKKVYSTVGTQLEDRIGSPVHYPLRKPKGFWCKEKYIEFLNDKKMLSPEMLMLKWGISRKKSIAQIAAKCRYRLKNIKEDEE